MNSYITPGDKIACVVIYIMQYEILLMINGYFHNLIFMAIGSLCFCDFSVSKFSKSQNRWKFEWFCTRYFIAFFFYPFWYTINLFVLNPYICGFNLIIGADDFLPILIWVVLGCQVSQLYTNCEYIENFHDPQSLRSRAGYCFVNLR
jgi:hypothetical protein